LVAPCQAALRLARLLPLAEAGLFKSQSRLGWLLIRRRGQRSWQTTRERFASSFEPPVRELRPGELPREWANDDDTVALEAPPASEPELLPVAPAELPPITGPQQYQMQFTTSEEHVKLVERATALLARERPGLALGEVHLEAMKLLVAALEK
jgi:hypothetical protein